MQYRNAFSEYITTTQVVKKFYERCAEWGLDPVGEDFTDDLDSYDINLDVDEMTITEAAEYNEFLDAIEEEIAESWGTIV